MRAVPAPTPLLGVCSLAVTAFILVLSLLAGSFVGVGAVSEFQRSEFPDQDIYNHVDVIYQSKEFQRNSIVILNLPGAENEDSKSDVRHIKMLLNIAKLDYCDVRCIFRIADPTEGRGVVVNFQSVGCKNLITATTATKKIRESYTYRNVVVQAVLP